MPVFDCVYQISPVCPYCGTRQGDPFELEPSDGENKEIDCKKCKLSFIVTAWISVYYDTKPVDPAAVREYCTANDLEIPDCVKA